jgi:hypothetical protein
VVELEEHELPVVDGSGRAGEGLDRPDGRDLLLGAGRVAVGGQQIAEQRQGVGLRRDRGGVAEARDGRVDPTVERVDPGKTDERAEVGRPSGKRGLVALAGQRGVPGLASRLAKLEGVEREVAVGVGAGLGEGLAGERDRAVDMAADELEVGAARIERGPRGGRGNGVVGRLGLVEAAELQE